MKITVEGSVYDFDMNKLLVSEAIFVKEKTGLMFRAWQRALAEGDPVSMKALVFVMKRRAGESPDWDTLDFDLAAIDVETEAEPGPKGDAPVA